MADDSVNYEIQFGVSIENAAQAEAEMKRLDKRMQELQASGDTTGDAFREVGTQINALADHVKGLVGSNKKLRTEFGSLNKELTTLAASHTKVSKAAKEDVNSFENLTKSIQKLSSAYAKLERDQTAAANADEINAIAKGAAPEDLSEEQRVAILKLDEAGAVNFVAEVRKIQQASDAAKDALNSLNAASERADFQNSIAGASRMEKALAELERAERDYAAAQDKSSMSGSAENYKAEEQALNRLQAARQKYASARQQAGQQQQAAEAKQRAEFEKNVQAQEKAAQQQIAQQKKLADARRELDDSEDRLNMEQEVNGLQKNERAQENLTLALRKRARAQDELRNAEPGSDEEVQAVQNLTRANHRLADAQREVNSTVPAIEAQRYAYYDVGRTILGVTAAITAAGVGTSIAFADWQSGMSNVAQTTGLFGDNVKTLEGDLISLATSAEAIPIALSDLQDVAAMAGQLGIGETAGSLSLQSAEIAEFTEQISKFSTISGVGAEAAAQTIAKLSNLLGDNDFEAIASSIAQVEVTSAASTQDLFNMVRELAQLAPLMNLTTEEVIGLSGGLASMGVPAERARSVFLQFSNVVNESMAGIDPERLNRMAAQMGMTADAAAELWKSDSTEFTQRLAESLQNTENMAVALQEMGLEGARAQPVFAAMSKNADLIARSMSEAREGYGDTTTYDERYAEYLNDLASAWQVFVNQVQVALITLGETVGPAIVPILQMVGTAITDLTEFLGTDFGQKLVEVAGVVGTVAVALGGLLGTLALVRGSYLGFLTLLGGSGGAMGVMIGGLQRGISWLFGFNQAAWTAGTRLQRLAIMGRVGGRVLGLSLAASFAVGAAAADDSTSYIANVWTFLWKGLVGTVLTVAGVILEGVYTLVAGVMQLFRGMALGTAAILDRIGMDSVADNFRSGAADIQASIDSTYGTLDQWAKAISRDFLGPAEDAFKNFMGLSGGPDIEVPEELLPDISDLNALFQELDESMLGAGDTGTGAMGDIADGAKDAAKELRTLVDYAGDLSGVFQRAYDLRFGSMLSSDSILTSWYDIADAFDEARKKVRDLQQSIRELRAEMQGTRSSITQLEYFLSIAVEYGDVMRAQEIEAELAKLRAEQAKQAADLADKTEELAAAKRAESGDLKGNSREAINNRKTLADLVGTYQEHLRVLAESGMSQADLAKESQRLKAEFIAQALQMGYSRKEVLEFAKAFDDMSKIIAVVPRNVTIEFDGDPALTALREFLAQAEQDIANFNANNPIGGGVPDGGGGWGEETERTFKRYVEPIGQRIGQWAMPTEAFLESFKKLPDGWRTFAPFDLDESEEYWTGFGGQAEAAITPIVGLLKFLLPREMEKSGDRAGRNFRSSFRRRAGDTPVEFAGIGKISGIAFSNGLLRTTEGAGTRVANAIAKSMGSSSSGFSRVGRDSGTAFQNAAVGAANSGITGRMSNVANNAGSAFNRQFSRHGTNAGNRFRSSAVNAIKAGTNTAAYNAGWSAGDSFIKAMQTNLNGKPIRFSGNFTKVGGNLKASLWTGGYTGRGGKYEPAGIVHKGEYVVPKHGVDQATGLPRADYMNSLGQPHRGSRASYASGGYAGGGNSGIMVVELSAADRRAIANSKSPVNVFLDGDKLARSGNAANLNMAGRGTN